MNYLVHLSLHKPWTLIIFGCIQCTRLRIPILAFSAAGVLMHLEGRAAKHKRCLIDYFLLALIQQEVFPYGCFCLCTKSTVYALLGGRSGKSRHGIPLFSNYTIALSIARLFFIGRPSGGFHSVGRNFFILIPLCST